VGEASRSLLPEPVAILFFDCTTLSFETAVEDALRQHGFGKDGKHKDSQVLLALMVTREGLPIGYAICRPRCRSRFLRPTHTPRWRARGTGGSANGSTRAGAWASSSAPRAGVRRNANRRPVDGTAGNMGGDPKTAPRA